MNGGRWVIDLKIGTKISPPTPRKKIVLRWLVVSSLAWKLCACSLVKVSSPFSESDRM